MFTQNRISCLILDCDGVLVDSEPIAARALTAALAETGILMTAHEVMMLTAGKSREAILEAIAGFGVKNPAACLRRKETIEAVRLQNDLQALPGVIPVLAHLSRNGIPFCIASNSPHRRLALTLGAVGIRKLAGGRVFSAEEVRAGKPDPALFLHAAEMMGFYPEECLVIDDSPSGIEAACRVGMLSMGFTGANRLGPVWEEVLLTAGASGLISHFTSIPALLSRLSVLRMAA
ncbi:MAG: HAD family phosphatase [Sutterella sp.]|nr:HAD family phosphatase [Sutterella sp.]